MLLSGAETASGTEYYTDTDTEDPTKNQKRKREEASQDTSNHQRQKFLDQEHPFNGPPSSETPPSTIYNQQPCAVQQFKEQDTKPPPVSSGPTWEELESVWCLMVSNSKINDTIMYAETVRDEFQDDPDFKMVDFLDLMYKFESQQIDTSVVQRRLIDLFQGHDQLILGFNYYVPLEYRVSLEDLYGKILIAIIHMNIVYVDFGIPHM